MCNIVGNLSTQRKLPPFSKLLTSFSTCIISQRFFQTVNRNMYILLYFFLHFWILHHLSKNGENCCSFYLMHNQRMNFSIVIALPSKWQLPWSTCDIFALPHPPCLLYIYMYTFKSINIVNMVDGVRFALIQLYVAGLSSERSEVWEAARLLVFLALVGKWEHCAHGHNHSTTACASGKVHQLLTEVWRCTLRKLNWPPPYDLRRWKWF